MTIKDVGYIAEGLSSETIDNCIQLHIKDGFPLIEIYSPMDDFGNFLWDDNDLEDIAKELKIMWNERVGE